MVAAPVLTPMYVERPITGSLFRPELAGTLFSSERRPRSIGDTLKVDISETLKASQKRGTDTSRQNQVSVKGPGHKSDPDGLVEKFLNMDASASGSDSYKGAGSSSASTEFAAQIAVSVVNVLPNGHLIVAGERRIGLNNNASILRFAGVVNPQDIKVGNVVSSRDVVNASLESVAAGDVSEATSRTWLQRATTRLLTAW